jgi:hypothetical protein
MRGKPSEAGILHSGKAHCSGLKKALPLPIRFPNTGKEKAAWGGGFFVSAAQ